MVEIKKGIPLPERRNSHLKDYYEAIEKMVVGDCFDVDVKELNTTIERFRGTIGNFAKRQGIKIASRTDVKGILTIWRIK